MTAFPFFRLAVIGALALSFALTACGRKGALDLPPGSSAAPVSDQQQAQSGESTEDEFGNPVQPMGQKKAFPLDVLIN